MAVDRRKVSGRSRARSGCRKIPRDLYNLLKAVRHPLAASSYSYAQRYCAAFDNGFGLDTNGASNLEELAEIVAGIPLRRTKDDALDLPPKLRAWQPVEVSEAAIGRLEASALEYLEKNPSPPARPGSTFSGSSTAPATLTAVAKVGATIEAVRERVEAGEKVVVFTSYTAVVKKLTKAFGEGAVSITGEHTTAERQQAADALQSDPDVRVLVGNLQAAGVGINLTAATHVIFNDLDRVPGNHWQTEDRIYRIGQTRPAFVTSLHAEGTLDDFVAALLEAKARKHRRTRDRGAPLGLAPPGCGRGRRPRRAAELQAFRRRPPLLGAIGRPARGHARPAGPRWARSARASRSSECRARADPASSTPSRSWPE